MPHPHNVSFRTAAGVRLAGVIDLPDGAVRAHALYAHCFTCAEDITAAYHIGQALAVGGVAMLRFDFAGLRGSSAGFTATNLSTNVGDLVAAATWLRKHGSARLLIGHSLGGLAALLAAEDLPEVQAVATIGAPYESDHLRQRVLPESGEDDAGGGEGERIEVTVGGRSVGLRRQLFDDLAGHDPASAIAGLWRPLLVCHAPDDDLVGMDQADRIFQAARQPKSLVALDGANHLLDRREDAERVAGIVLAWANRYLP